ncbi:MAG: FAD-binding domain-containing protein, partial [Algiphilus sp.]
MPSQQNNASTGPEPVEARRADGLEVLAHFTPRMGRHYANGRNVDRGPGKHRDVSLLSPYLRRRLLLEEEAVAAALEAHGLEGAEKFIQEVFWRGYFKGWLERRPTVWSAYRDGLVQDLATLEKDRRLRRQLEQAEAGATGLDCFDAWAEELCETGYLHNHARMWFASIWIFTFDLPWRLGADFFYRHLLDGDPASNTLSWRWVAGLHTRGKPYAAQAWNIAKFTNQRFRPRDSDLAGDVHGLDHLEPEGLPDVEPLRAPRSPDPALPSALLLTEEDCRPGDFALA